MCLWAALMLLIRHSSLIGIHLTAVVMLIAVLFCTLWMTYYETFQKKCKNFSLFLTDAARYMSLAGKTIKKLYPSLMHVNCVVLLSRNCAMHVCAHFKNIDGVLASIKAATIKNKRSQERLS